MAESSSSEAVSYFEEAYRDYHRQNPPEKLEHYLAQVEDACGDRPVDLLDIGCGLGSFLRHVSESRPEWRLHATDMDAVAVATTREVVPRATVELASAEEKPFPDGSFDIITAWDVIEHVPDLAAVAKAVGGMLRPGGAFLFVVPVYDTPVGWMVRLLDRDRTHIHKRSRRFWLQWATGWCRVEEWHGVFRYLFGTRYLHFPTRRWRAWAPSIVVRCVRPPAPR